MADGTGRVCAGIGCNESMDGRRKDAKFCSNACNMRTRRMIEEFGVDVAEWAERSERFWAGMAALANRATVRGRRPRAGVPA